MNDKALVVIDLQNDITKNYKDIIGNVNCAIDRAVKGKMHVVYVRHNNVTAETRTFKEGTRGADFVPEMKIVSENVFVKTKASATTNEEFVKFFNDNDIKEIFVAGADATACVKSTCYNLVKLGFSVCVLSDCITSYDKTKIPEMLDYYQSKGCKIATSNGL